MLGPIIAVTMTITDLAPVEAAYADYLGYHVVERGTVSDEMADLWGAPKAAGNNYILMQPESGLPHYLRFVEAAPYPDYDTVKTYGWNATEILVMDVDAVAEKLRDSPFKIIGEPRNLSSSDDIKAMQVIGPAKELLYLTTVKDPNHKVGQAKSFVDRVFIVINGGPDMAALAAFYSGFGNGVSDPIPVRMSALNRLYGLDLELRHPLSVVDLNGPFLIELDQYPEQARPRSVRPGDIPPGTSMVSFAVPSLDALRVDFAAPPRPMHAAPYGGRRAAVAVGPAGEWLELVETAP